MVRALTTAELAAGWRLGCHARANGPVVLDVAQWEFDVLSDAVQLSGGIRDGAGVAVDLGTTTVVAQALDLRTGQVFGVRTGLNPQCAHGADIMSRVQFALHSPELTSLIRNSVGRMIEGVLGRRDDVREVVLVGNTVMHHLFAGLPVASLAAVPFRSQTLDERTFSPRELGWKLPDDCAVRFARCIGGFVGSDILAGIAAVGLHRAERLSALIDLGTNGEIVVGDRRGLQCASTAAGPAFEAACISSGMRAARGAIAEVSYMDRRFECQVIGGGPARGICGSGLVDAAAAALDAGLLLANGAFVRPVWGRPPACGGLSARQTCGATSPAQGTALPHKARPSLSLTETVALSQRDLRELQLAKAAIAAGLRILCAQRSARVDDLDRVYLAGAFGNYIRVASAERIGLLEIDPERVEPAGNTALRGGKLALLDPLVLDGIEVEHVELAAVESFQETFVDCLGFPEVPCNLRS
jgi:uncharacterized 2Fe-2S/4Fe-4S cluster protein (DUF4445 family)